MVAGDMQILGPLVAHGATHGIVRGIGSRTRSTCLERGATLGQNIRLYQPFIGTTGVKTFPSCLLRGQTSVHGTLKTCGVGLKEQTRARACRYCLRDKRNRPVSASRMDASSRRPSEMPTQVQFFAVFTEGRNTLTWCTRSGASTEHVKETPRTGCLPRV